MIPASALGKRAALQTVARTPRDKPIVCAGAAARIENGIAREVRVALGGVASSAVRAGDAEKELEGKKLAAVVIESAARRAANGLKPRGDFRGSVEYRNAMAVVLAQRAMEAL